MTTTVGFDFRSAATEQLPIVRHRKPPRINLNLVAGLAGEILWPKRMPTTVSADQLIGPWLADARAQDKDFKPAYYTLAWISLLFAVLVAFIGFKTYSWSVVDAKVQIAGVLTMGLYVLGAFYGLEARRDGHSEQSKMPTTFVVSSLLVTATLVGLSTIGICGYNFAMSSVLN